jgi:O-antigen ligase
MSSILNNIRNILFILLGFTFPLSISISSILIILLAILLLFQEDIRGKIKKVISSKWMISILALLFLYYISPLFFGFFTDTSWVLKRVSLLLILPILYSFSFSQKTINLSIFAFLSSMFLSSVIALADNYEIIQFTKNWTWSAFLQYTEHNVFLAIALLLSFYTLFRVKLSLFNRNILLVFILTFLFSLFTEGGKAGQLVFIISIILFFIFHFKDKRTLMFFSVLSVFIFSVVIYHSSPIVKKRFTHEIKSIRSAEPSFRNNLFIYSVDLIQENPIIGYGTGSFTDVFKEVNKSTKRTVDYDHKTPHNNYLYIWFELGIIGLIVFMFIFYFQIKELLQKKDALFRVLFPLIYLIIMLADSYFFSHNTLIMYLFLSVITLQYQYKPS